MPYIPLARRALLDPVLYQVDEPQTAGELNYVFTRFAQNYLAVHGKSYATINDIVGALEGAKAEFQRRVVAPYEDRKIKEQGDVY